MIPHIVYSSGRVLSEAAAQAMLDEESHVPDPSEVEVLRINFPVFLSEANAKQKAWALDVMSGCVVGFYKEAKQIPCPAHKLQVIFDIFQECLLCQQDARWWIDHRARLKHFEGWKVVIDDVIGWSSYLRHVMSAPAIFDIPTTDRKYPLIRFYSTDTY